MATNNKIKVICRYGGEICPRPHDHRLFYLGGETKILAVDRHVRFYNLIAKLKSLTRTPNFSLKYRLPGKDIDDLESLMNDVDIEKMIDEYEWRQMMSLSPNRIRLFLFCEPGKKLDSDQDHMIAEQKIKSVKKQKITGTDNLHGQDSLSLNPDFLFWFDKEHDYEDIKPTTARPEFPEKHTSTNKMKLICSYGGEICPRPHDHRLFYLGGETKILTIDRHVRFHDLIAKLKLLSQALDFSLKYRLLGKDLEDLVSLMNDDDLEKMMDEYEWRQMISPSLNRLGLFLFCEPEKKLDSDLDHQIAEQEIKSVKMQKITGTENLHGQDSLSLNPDFLFGFDKEHNFEYLNPITARPEFPEKPIPIIPKDEIKVSPHESHTTIHGHINLFMLMPAVRFIYQDYPVHIYMAPRPIWEIYV